MYASIWFYYSLYKQVVRAGVCKLSFTFKEPTKPENLQTLYVCCIRPTILKIDSDRRITTSFTQN